MVLGSTQPLTEMSTRCISWGGKCGRCVRLTTLPPSCAVVMKSGNLNSLGPSGPLHACNWTVLSLPLPFTLRENNKHLTCLKKKCQIKYFKNRISFNDSWVLFKIFNDINSATFLSLNLLYLDKKYGSGRGSDVNHVYWERKRSRRLYENEKSLSEKFTGLRKAEFCGF